MVIYLIDAVLAVLVVMLEWVFSAETGEEPFIGPFGLFRTPLIFNLDCTRKAKNISVMSRMISLN